MHQLLKSQPRGSKKIVNNKQLRKEGFVPAVIYGKGMESISIKVPEREISRFLVTGNHLLEVEFEGKKYLVNMEKVEREQYGQRRLQHITFHNLNRDDKTSMVVPLNIVGGSGWKNGRVIRQQLKEITVIGKPDDLVDHVDLDPSVLDKGKIFHVKDLKLPKGLTLADNEMDRVVAICYSSKMLEEIPQGEKVEEAAQ